MRAFEESGEITVHPATLIEDGRDRLHVESIVTDHADHLETGTTEAMVPIEAAEIMAQPETTTIVTDLHQDTETTVADHHEIDTRIAIMTEDTVVSDASATEDRR